MKREKKKKPSGWGPFLRQIPRLHMPVGWILAAFAVAMGMQTVMLMLPQTTAELMQGKLTGAALAGAVVYYILLALIGFVQVLLQMIAESMTVRRARESLWRKMLRVKMEYYNENDPSTLMSAVTTDLAAGMADLTNLLIYMIPSLYYVAAALWTIGSYHPLLCVSCVAIFPLKYVYLAVIGKRYFSVTQKLYTRIGSLTAYLADRISHLHIIKAYTNEAEERAAGNDVSAQLYRANMGVVHTGCLDTGISTAITIAQNIVVIVVGVLLLQQGAITTEQWLAFFLFATNLFTAFDSAAYYWIKLKTIQGAAARTVAVMSAPEEDLTAGSGCAAADGGDITFDHVSFTYGQNEAPSVRDISFTIPSGSSAAFVGLCGSGKTTMLSLLERFYQPQEGTITLGGVPVEEYRLEDYRRRFCYVQQGADIFGGTVRQAMTYGLHREAGDEELLEAARQAGFLDYILQQAEGLDAPVAPGGASLSGGQNQRLVLAREYLRGGSIVLMDEPTSALDPAASLQVRRAMETLFRGRTLIVVSHDLDLIAGLDQIIVMENGVCVGRGRHDQLLETCPLYRQMVSVMREGGEG